MFLCLFFEENLEININSEEIDLENFLKLKDDEMFCGNVKDCIVLFEFKRGVLRDMSNFSEGNSVDISVKNLFLIMEIEIIVKGEEIEEY